mmetsp:Transcript_16945/g.26999  ORF Transcript_16945/g.26999 Transcript_16945/m.26999 type:complete len:153 (-) Transcript_16945:750-1208(-)
MAQSNEDYEQQQLIAMLLQSLGGMNNLNGNMPANMMPQPQKKKPATSAYALEKQCVDIEISEKYLKKQKKCSICCEKFKLGGDATLLDPCKHFFHDLCILQWLKSNNTCPLCRKELMTVDYDYESSKWTDKAAKPDSGNNDDNNGNNSSMYV